MSTSQALMGLFSSDVRSVGAEAGARLSLPAGDGDAFAALLAEQLPAELEAVISELSPEQLARLEQATLAVGGNNLPAELQDWLQQLPGDEADPAAEDALAVIGQWMQLLQQDGARPATASATAQAAQVIDDPMAATARTQTRGELPVGMLAEGESAEALDGELLSRNPQGREQGAAEAGRQNLASAIQQGNQPAGQNNQLTQNIQQDFGALLQRSASEASPTAAALFGKLVEQMDSARPGRADERDALDGIERATAQTGTGSAALTARPVAAAMQPAAVPFGHQSWGEAMVERVMWMSSQNLRSVEIQLDPAELGPLEIHIQNRGQELQVQFISQNPGVREALEGQMHRLREMFAGQGLEQAEVSVADRSAGEQSRQGEGQLAERSAARGGSGSARGDAVDGEAPHEPVERIIQPLRGAVDFYV